MLETYGQCEPLLADLKESIYNEMLVSLDQQSYWHWASPAWRGGVVFAEDDVAMMDGAPEAESDLIQEHLQIVIRDVRDSFPELTTRRMVSTRPTS